MRGKTFGRRWFVITIGIVVLLVAVYVVSDLMRGSVEERNAQRWHDTNRLLTAIHDYIGDNDGVLPTGLSVGMSETQLGIASAGCAEAIGGACGEVGICIDLSIPLAGYLDSIPVDPSETEMDKTGYSVWVNVDNVVTVRSCNAEGGTATIQVSR